MDSKKYTEYMHQKLLDTSDEFGDALCAEDAAEYVKKVEEQRNTSAYKFTKEALVNILRKSGRECDIDTDDAILKKFAEKLVSRDELMSRLSERLYNEMSSFPKTDDYMKRIVLSLGNPLVVSEENTTRVNILRQFLFLSDYHVQPVFKLIESIKGESGNDNNEKGLMERCLLADESVFERFEAMKAEIENSGDTADHKKQKLKDFNRKYILLKLADDLGTGRFRGNEGTRNNLYLFAMVFGMEYASRDSKKYDEEKDVEKNLFLDWYKNDILKEAFFDSYMNNKNHLGEDAFPTGEGINFKNYGEVIYLYCLAQKNLSVSEKIVLSEELLDEYKRNLPKKEINDAVHIEKTNGNLNCLENDKYYPDSTDIYKEFYSEEVLKLGKDELIPYLYKFYPMPEDNNTNALHTANYEVSAQFYYDKLLKNVTKNYIKDDGNVKGIKEILGAYNSDEPYRRTIKKYMDFMSVKKLFPGKNGEVKMLRNDGRVTRMELLRAIYFNFLFENPDLKLSFGDLWIELKAYSDAFLSKCRFQLLSSKNAFDVFMAYRLYCEYTWV